MTTNATPTLPLSLEPPPLVTWPWPAPETLGLPLKKLLHPQDNRTAQWDTWSPLQVMKRKWLGRCQPLGSVRTHLSCLHPEACPHLDFLSLGLQVAVVTTIMSNNLLLTVVNSGDNNNCNKSHRSSLSVAVPGRGHDSLTNIISGSSLICAKR